MNPRPNKRVARRQLQRTQDEINKRKRNKITSLEKQLKEAQARIAELEKERDCCYEAMSLYDKRIAELEDRLQQAAESSDRWKRRAETGEL